MNLVFYEICTFVTYTFYVVYVVDVLGRPKRRWEDNMKMDLREVG